MATLYQNETYKTSYLDLIRGLRANIIKTNPTSPYITKMTRGSNG